MEKVHVCPGLLETERREKARRLEWRNFRSETQGGGYAYPPTKEISQQRHLLKRQISLEPDIIHVSETAMGVFSPGNPVFIIALLFNITTKSLTGDRSPQQQRNLASTCSFKHSPKPLLDSAVLSHHKKTYAMFCRFSSDSKHLFSLTM